MADIGKLALILSADSTGLSVDLDKATKKVKHFAEDATSVLSNFAKTAALPMVGIGIAVEGIKKALDVIPGGEQVSKLFGVGGSAAIEGQIEKIKELHHEAEKIGISVEGWQVLAAGAKGAGIETGALAASMRKLGAELGAAVRDPMSDAGKAFKMFGLNAKELASGPLDVAYRKILEFGRGMDKNSAMFMLKTLGGKGGAEMLPLIEKNFGEVEKKLERTGTGITEHDVKLTMDLVKATKELDAVYEGLTNKILRLTVGPKTDFYKGLARILEGDVSGKEFSGAALDAAIKIFMPDTFGGAEFKRQRFGDIGDTVGGDFGKIAAGKHHATISLEEIKKQQDAEAALEKLYKDAEATAQTSFEQKMSQFDALSAAQDRYIETTGKSITQIAEYDAKLLGLEGNALAYHMERAAQQEEVFKRQDIATKALGIATGMLGAAPASLPTAATFGSEAALNSIAQQAQQSKGDDKDDIKTIADKAVEEAAKNEVRHKELVDAIEDSLNLKKGVLPR